MNIRTLPQLSKKSFFGPGLNVENWILEWVSIFKSIILDENLSVGNSYIRYQFSIEILELINLLDKLDQMTYSDKQEKLLSLKNLCSEFANTYQNTRDEYVLSIINTEISGLKKQAVDILDGQQLTDPKKKDDFRRPK